MDERGLVPCGGGRCATLGMTGKGMPRGYGLRSLCTTHSSSSVRQRRSWVGWLTAEADGVAVAEVVSVVCHRVGSVREVVWRACGGCVGGVISDEVGVMR